MPETDPLTTLVDRMSSSVDLMSGNIEQLSKAVRRSRIQLVVLAVSVMLDLMLSIGFFYALHGTNEAEHQTNELVAQIAKNNSATQQRCLAFNESNTRELELWTGLLALPKAPGTPPTDPATLDAFNKLLGQTFYQIDCSAIGK